MQNSNNSRKRKILVVALIISLIAIITVGSLAWFTAKDEVTNTLKFDNKFSIDVYETYDNGTVIKNDSGETVGKTYENIMPGQEIHKDPTVRNTGTHNEYVRVNVTLSNYDIWRDAVKPDISTGKVDLATIFTGFDPNAWTRYDAPTVDEENNTVTYTFYLTKYRESNVLPPNDAAALFTGVTIPGDLTSEQTERMKNEFTIKVEAEAIQTENLPEGVDTAYEAFKLLDD